MKIFLPLLAMFIIAQSSYAQFTPMTGAPNNYYYNNGGIFIGPNYDTGNKFYVGGSGHLVNFSNMEDQDLEFVLSAPFATDKYALIMPSTETSLAFGSGGVEKMRLTSAGKVGMGIKTPQAILHTAGGAAGANTVGLYVQNSGGTSNGTAVSIDFTNTTALTAQAPAARIGAIRTNRASNGDSDIAFSTLSNGTLTERFRIMDNGYVGINTATPKEALSVNGNIRAKQVKVETTNFPDYVFTKDYKLPTLKSVSDFIQANHHLPEIPPASEVHANGQDLGEMNKLLLKKVEELTLYVIELKKENDQIKKVQENIMKKMLLDNSKLSDLRNTRKQ